MTVFADSTYGLIALKSTQDVATTRKSLAHMPPLSFAEKMITYHILKKGSYWPVSIGKCGEFSYCDKLAGNNTNVQYLPQFIAYMLTLFVLQSTFSVLHNTPQIVGN